MAPRDADVKLLRTMVTDGTVSREAAELALKASRSNGRTAMEELVAQGVFTAEEGLQALELELQVPCIRLADVRIDPLAVQLVPEELARRHEIIAIGVSGDELTLAMGDPLDVMVSDEVQRLTGLRVRRVMAHGSEVRTAVDRYYGDAASLEQAVKNVDQRAAATEAERSPDAANLGRTEQNANSPVARLVQSSIERALHQRASDIHLEPGVREGVLRIRVDGVLRDLLPLSMKAYPSIVSRMKILAGMDISERRVPQDGRFGIDSDGRLIDLRVSTLPTILGEKVVLRILDKRQAQFLLDDMGLPEREGLLLNEAITQPHGMLIVTGPTGSGKTTTLYAILQQLNDSGQNIVTCEDPVEYQLDRINQVQLNTRAGLTFEAFLRSALRQDPDIIMVGEMRDPETAELGVRAAMTGHLVLSTLHTNDAVGVAPRLIDMGLAPYLVASTLIGAISQRLVRTNCPHCREQLTIRGEEVQRRYPRLGLAEDMVVAVSHGCPSCERTGYSGRQAVFELFVPDDHLRGLISERASGSVLMQAAREGGMASLRDAVIERVRSGETTLEEAVRVTSS
jgi:type IV pilus assembly protein PilB